MKKHATKERGKLITFEGLDGGGKSTQAAMLAGWLRDSKGLRVLETREPGGTAFGERVRKMALEEADLDGATETLLMAAARCEHAIRAIEPALAAGVWVVCDRFSDSTFAYQGGGRGVCEKWIGEVLREAEKGLSPALTFYLRVPEKMPGGGRRVSFSKGALFGDNFESRREEYHRAVAAAYERLASSESERIVAVGWEDKTGVRRDKKAVAAEIQSIIAERLRL